MYSPPTCPSTFAAFFGIGQVFYIFTFHLLQRLLPIVFVLLLEIIYLVSIMFNITIHLKLLVYQSINNVLL